jgi:predicted RNase H-like HicB family nuclease
MKKNRVQNKSSKKIAFEYQVNISFDVKDQIYVARVPELENCHSHGNSPEEALKNANEAIELWLQVAREESIEIPEPMSRKKFSGKFIVRTPEDLHATLAQEALRRGQSMNELTVELIRKGLKRVG